MFAFWLLIQCDILWYISPRRSKPLCSMVKLCIDGLTQNSSKSSPLAKELLQYWIKASILGCLALQNPVMLNSVTQWSLRNNCCNRWYSLLNSFIFAMRYSDVVMGAMATLITGVSIVYPTDCSDQRNHNLCAGNSPMTGDFPAQRTSNAENVSIWWRHYWNTVGMLSCVHRR